jgi:hypothetical protein
MIFPVGIAAAKAACANHSQHSWILCVARESGGVELRRKAGRTDWPGQAQIKHTMKKL